MISLAICSDQVDLYNQWLQDTSKQWRDNGYAWLPFDYVKQYVFEKWVFDIEKGT